MVSAFQSREFGFGLDITKEQMVAVNRHRNGKNYHDKDAANFVLSKFKKNALKESPFIRFFEYGTNQEGYWSYNHMIVQLEDCIDCLKVLYPEFRYVFLYDHSSGHSKKRKGGLNSSSMNRSFGGTQ